MNWKSTSAVSNLVLRVTVGISMIFIGISQYRDFAPFLANVTDGMGPLSFLGTVWGFLLPALLIFGGGTLAVGRYSFVAAWTGGVAIGSIIIGFLFKTVLSGLPLPDMLAEATPVMIWLIAFILALQTVAEEPVTEEQVV